MARDVDVTILTSGHDVADARLHREVAALVREGLRVEVLGLGEPTAGPSGAEVTTWVRRGPRGRATLAAEMAMRARGRVLMTLDPDSAIAASAASTLMGRRLVVDVHEDYARLLHDRSWASGATGKIASSLVRAFQGVAVRADLTIVADDHVPPLRARSRLVVPNLPDTAMLPPAGPRGQTPRALYVGDVRESRGLFAMVEAIRLAPGWHLDIVGPVAPSDQSRLTSVLGDPEAGDLAARVHLHGRRPPAKAWEFAREAWVGLLLMADTPAFRDAVPSKLYEYLACGLACVTTDLPRPARIVTTAGAGVVVPSDLPLAGEAVAAQLRAWSADPAGLDVLRAAATAYATETGLLGEGPYAGFARAVRECVDGRGGPRRGVSTEDVKDRVRGVRAHLPVPVVEAAERVARRRPAGAAAGSSELVAASRRPEVPATPVRLLIAPANFAGQGFQWARALERHVPGVSAVSMSVTNPLGFEVDYQVSAEVYRTLSWQRAQRDWVLENFTHVLVEAERPVFGPLYGRTCAQEIPRLRAGGLSVGLLSHGSDLRVPSRHRELFPDSSPFTDLSDPQWAVLEKRALHNRALVDDFEGPVFVSTPDLLDYAPGAIWCPGVIDIDLWATERPVFSDSGAPLVVHIPSSGRLKGTDVIDKALAQLEREGVVRYRTLTGVAHEDMPAAYAEADIVIDQVLMGLYGVTAVEALATGRVVVGFVGEAVRRRVLQAAGVAVPIVEADRHTLRDVIIGLVEDRDRARGIAASGVPFARAVHDGRFSAEALTRLTGRPAVHE